MKIVLLKLFSIEKKTTIVINNYKIKVIFKMNVI